MTLARFCGNVTHRASFGFYQRTDVTGTTIFSDTVAALVFSQNRVSFRQATTIRPRPIDKQHGDATVMTAMIHQVRWTSLIKTCHKHLSHQDWTPPATRHQCRRQRLSHSKNQAMRPDARDLQSIGWGGDVPKPPNQPTVVVPPPQQKQPSLPPLADQEEAEKSNSQKTRRCTDEDSDLVLDEALWTQFTHDPKVCSNTGFFNVPKRY